MADDATGTSTDTNAAPPAPAPDATDHTKAETMMPGTGLPIGARRLPGRIPRTKKAHAKFKVKPQTP